MIDRNLGLIVLLSWGLEGGIPIDFSYPSSGSATTVIIVLIYDVLIIIDIKKILALDLGTIKEIKTRVPKQKSFPV